MALAPTRRILPNTHAPVPPDGRGQTAKSRLSADLIPASMAASASMIMTSISATVRKVSPEIDVSRSILVAIILAVPTAHASCRRATGADSSASVTVVTWVSCVKEASARRLRAPMAASVDRILQGRLVSEAFFGFVICYVA